MQKEVVTEMLKKVVTQIAKEGVTTKKLEAGYCLVDFIIISGATVRSSRN